MEEKKPAPQVIAVMTIGMDARKQAIFRMAFKMYSVQRYLLMDDAGVSEPDVAIVDWDTAGVESSWAEFRAKYPKLPAVAVTVTPTDAVPAPAVTKPVRMEALFPLLRQVLAGETVAQPKPAAALNVVTGREPAKAEVQKSVSAPRSVAAEPTNGAKAPEAKVAAPATPPAPTPATPRPAAAPRAAEPENAAAKAAGPQLPATIERFDARIGVLGALREIRRQRVPTLVTIGGEEAIIALPGQDSALLRVDMAAIRRACDSPGTAVAIRPLTPQDAPPRGASPYSFTALLWQASLWTSRGRLMDGVQADTPVRLRHWPNLTRLAAAPEAMRIAALWVRFPINLRLTVRMLNVQPEHVFDFLAASHSIGILDVRESGAEVVALAPQPPATPEEKERGGLLSRLLRKVVRL